MRHKRTSWIAGIVSLGMIAIGCAEATDAGGVASLSDGANAAGEAAEQDESFEDALLAYTRCMRREGVEMPDPEEVEGGSFVVGGSAEVQGEGGGGDGGGSMVAAAPVAGAPVGSGSLAEFEAADAKCSHLLPESATLSPEEEAELQDKMLEFARCMRQHGVDMPDPPANGPQVGVTLADIEDPAFQKAQDACGSIMPGFGSFEVEKR